MYSPKCEHSEFDDSGGKSKVTSNYGNDGVGLQEFGFKRRLFGYNQKDK